MKLLIATLAVFFAAADHPALGGYRAVPVGDPAAAKALATTLDLIHKDAALARLDLANPELLGVERQIVAGQNLRTTARVGGADHRRVLRAVVYRTLGGKTSLTSVELGPIGAKELPQGAGPINGLPGGYSQQDPADAETRQTAEEACKLLGDPAWLGQGVLLSKVQAASTQVVAGFNHHLLLRAAVKGGERTVDLIYLQPAVGKPLLTWVKLSS